MLVNEIGFFSPQSPVCLDCLSGRQAFFVIKKDVMDLIKNIETERLL
ncbi:MAG: hypothetical protein HZC12_01370 [Nitrospirae bacterium]|nr:hypothetical protein [Nitrospirota bacterium]